MGKKAKIFYLLCSWFASSRALARKAKKPIFIGHSMFPTATVTTYHKLRGLKQHKFIILQFWNWEIRNRSHRAKVKMLARPHSFWRFPGRIHFLASSSFWRPPAFLGSQPFLCLQNQHRSIFGVFSDSDLLPLSSTHKRPCDYIQRPLSVRQFLICMLSPDYNSSWSEILHSCGTAASNIHSANNY